MLWKVHFSHWNIRERLLSRSVIEILLFRLNHLRRIILKRYASTHEILLIGRDVISSFSSEFEIGSFKIASFCCGWSCISSMIWVHIFISSSAWRFQIVASSWICRSVFAQGKVILAILFDHFSFLIVLIICASGVLMDALSLLDQVLAVWLGWHLFFPC